MEGETTPPKPLIEQICDDMFAELEKHAEFDAQTLKILKALAAAGDLSKSRKVEAAVKATPGGAG